MMLYNSIFIKIIIFFGALCLVNMNALSQNKFSSEVTDAVLSYPAVISARNQVESSRADVDASKWGFYPTPSVGYERANKMVIGILNQDTKFLRDGLQKSAQ